MKKYTTDELENLIYKHWNYQHVQFYFAQVLSGEETIQSTIDDLESLEKSEGVIQRTEFVKGEVEEHE